MMEWTDWAEKTKCYQHLNTVALRGSSRWFQNWSIVLYGNLTTGKRFDEIRRQRNQGSPR